MARTSRTARLGPQDGASVELFSGSLFEDIRRIHPRGFRFFGKLARKSRPTSEPIDNRVVGGTYQFNATNVRKVL